MRKLISAVLVAGLFGVIAAAPVDATATKTYTSCAQLRKDYPKGVATSRAKAKKTKAKVSRAIYRVNKALDTNGNGIACEKGEKKPKAVPGSFGSGTKTVGIGGVNPGRYVTVNANDCYWERLSGFGGTFGEIITNDMSPGTHVVVDIQATDKGFSSNRCGTWLPYKPYPQTTITDGIWVIGDEIQPGTWSTSFDTFCYWERLSGFGGSLDEIISNELPSESAVVQIEATDVGFASSGCGTWTKIG